MKNTFYIYTSLFPYSIVSESFLATELEVVKDQYNITLIPVGKDKTSRAINPKIQIDNSICDCSLLYKICAILLIFRFTFLKELLKSGELQYILKYPKDLFKYLYATNLVYWNLKKKVKFNPYACFYSYWFSYPPIAFALYKSKYPSTKAKFISRAHGSDVYSVDVGTYYPLRRFVSRYIDKVFTVSKFGKDYLINKYPDLFGKAFVSRLGVKKPQIQIGKKIDKNEVLLVSCSRVIELKRLPLIYESIANYTKEHPSTLYRWIHLGNGPAMGELLEEMDTNKAPSNLTVDLKGELKNTDILEFYMNNHIDCFILLSISEGVPVSIMEAMSYSIPILSTNVGGIGELVVEGSGELLDVNFTQLQFNEAIEKILNNQQTYRICSYNAFSMNYDALKNYSNFYNEALK